MFQLFFPFFFYLTFRNYFVSKGKLQLDLKARWESLELTSGVGKLLSLEDSPLFLRHFDLLGIIVGFFFFVFFWSEAVAGALIEKLINDQIWNDLFLISIWVHEANKIKPNRNKMRFWIR